MIGREREREIYKKHESQMEKNTIGDIYVCMTAKIGRYRKEGMDMKQEEVTLT